MGWELVVKVPDIAVLLDFFENGNPHPGRARPDALTFGTISGLIFTFQEKEFLFYDCFWVWGFSLLEGARVYIYGLVLEVPLALNLRERRVEWVPFWEEGKIFKLGKVAFGHGVYTNDLHAKKHCLRYGCELFVYGHTHAIQYYSAEMHGNGTTIAAVSLGCLCEPMPYMMGRPDRWEQAVGVLEMCAAGRGASCNKRGRTPRNFRAAAARQATAGGRTLGDLLQ